MTDEQIAILHLKHVLNNYQSITHGLTLDELYALIDEVKCIYERFSDITDARNGDKQ